jgi:hypothetical protein
LLVFVFQQLERTSLDESLSNSLIQSFTRVLLRIVFVFEPLAPTAIMLLINQQLKRFKDSGVIGSFKTKTKRLSKYHYKIEIDLDLSGVQAVHLIGNLFPQQINSYRRWFHD